MLSGFNSLGDPIGPDGSTPCLRRLRTATGLPSIFPASFRRAHASGRDNQSRFCAPPEAVQRTSPESSSLQSRSSSPRRPALR